MWRTNLLEKTGEDWRQEEKGTTEDEMVGWHHRLNGHEFEQAPGDDEGQGSLACCSPWGHKESDATEWLNLSSKESACQFRRHGFDPWSGKIPHAAGQLSLCATTIDPVLWSLGAATAEAQVPESPCSMIREPTTMRSTQRATGEQSLLAATRESPGSSEDSAQPKINKQNYFLKWNSSLKPKHITN